MTPDELEITLNAACILAIRTRYHHPGTSPTATKWRYCAMCGGEWPDGSPQKHEQIRREQAWHGCPIAAANTHFNIK